MNEHPGSPLPRDTQSAGALAPAAPPPKPARRAPPVVPVSRQGTLPLSFAQLRLWFIDQLAPENSSYNVSYFMRLTGPLNAPALERAFVAWVQRHEALRTHFEEVDGRPEQRIAPHLDVALPVEALDATGAEDAAIALRRLAEAEVRRPFQLKQGPMFRARLIQLAPQVHALLFTVHHIICDVWSLGLMERELKALYVAALAGAEPTLPPLTVQYADYVAWQREWMRGDVLEGQLAWWKAQLAGALASLDLPTDRPRPPVQSSRGARYRVALPATLSTDLQTLSRKEGVTSFMTLLAGFQALLARYSGQSDIVVGTPIAARGRRELEGVFGFFANTLALRVEVSGEQDFRTLLAQVRKVCLGAYAHPDVPLEQLVEALQPVRDLSRTPLFQVMFIQESGASALQLPGVAVEELEFEPGVSRFDLAVFMRETPDGIRSWWEYNTDLFDEATVARMAAHYARLLEGAVAQPSHPLASLPLLSEAERHQLLVEWNDSAVSVPPAPGAHSLFEEAVRRAPGAIAVRFEETTLTYDALNQHANRLAHLLREHGVGPDAPVALCVERSLSLPIALLAILKAGGAYCPLDPAYPPERLALMLQSSRAKLLLTQRHLEPSLPRDVAPVLLLDDDAPALAAQPGTNPAPISGPDHLAYVIFTSGSTGVPKAVAMPHRQLLNLIHWQNLRSTAPRARTLQFSALSFDVCFQELLPTLVAGGEVVLLTDDVRRDTHALLHLLRERAVERLFLPFVALQHLAEVSAEEGLLPLHLLEINTAGEQLRLTPALRRMLRALPACALDNHYGPTETHAGTAFMLRGAPESWPDLPPIGKPITNARIYLLDAYLQPVPLGVPGELYIGGKQLARGYLHRPDLTAERFLPDCHAPTPGERMYRTGDFARFLPSGDIEFLGRRDAQVKVRGYRVELHEVEAALSAVEGVQDVAVVARDEAGLGKQLFAYVVPKPGITLDTATLRSALKGRLPEYMVPAAFTTLAAFPLTPSGKLDRKALPTPVLASDEESFVAPRTPVETAVASLWAQLLHLPRVGVSDNFFERGGHSLLATQVVSRLRTRFLVDLPLRALFEHPTVEELAHHLQSLVGPQASASTLPPAPPLVAKPRTGPLPLSFAQQRLWFIHQFDTASFAYNLPLFLQLRGPLDVGALEQGFSSLIQRHEALRTTFTQVDSRPVQVLSPVVDFVLASRRIDSLDEALRLAEEEVRRPFDLRQGPLVRASLLQVEPHHHVLLITLHHIVCDGWSLDVLQRELAAFYTAFSRGQPAPVLPSLSVQYADFSRWQREWLTGTVLDSLLASWKQRLAGAPPALELPTDLPRPPVQSFRGAHLPVSLPPELSGALDALCRQHGVTPFMALLASFHALLSRYSGQDDIVVGAPIAGRTQPELEPLIGFFANTVPLRLHLPNGTTFAQLLGRAREASLAAFAHQELPFEQLVDALGLERDLSRTPLFQVMFVLQNAATATLELPGITASTLDVETGMSKFDLTLFAQPTPTGLSFLWEYNLDLFTRTTVERMADHHARLLASALARPDSRISDLPLLSEAERHQLLVEWNRNEADFPRDATLHGLVEAQVRRTPDAVAVISTEKRLTYRELDARANQLAHRLRGMGVGPEVRVGLCVERTADMVVGVLGILKAGGAYVPLDPNYPKERLAWLLQDARGPALVAHSRLLATLPEHPAPAVCLDTDPELPHQPEHAPDVEVLPENLSYLIYTSGSTGRPKGVAIAHRNAVAVIQWSLDTYDRAALQGVLASTSLNFDMSVFELFAPLSCGGSVVVARNALHLAELPAANEVTLIDTVPSAMALLVQQGAVPPHAHIVNLGGEAIPGTLARLVYSVPTVHKLYNLYGPSEDTTFSTVSRVGVEREPDIGRPLSNTRAYLLDAQLQPVPVGVVGELYLAGEGTTRGYLLRPDLTAERYIPAPYGPPGSRMYRTGDRVKYRADGVLEYLGRADFQVKIRGFRVELGEIETALRAHDAVKDVVVVAVDEGVGKRLVGYVAPKPGHTLDAADLKTRLRQSLPEYMVPGALIVLDALPLNPNGKVDRKALPAPEAALDTREFVAPRTPLEQVVADIWAPLLGLSRLGAEDNFFDLGGHSLMATQAASRLRETLSIDFPVRLLFEARTVEALATRLEDVRHENQPARLPPLVPMKRSQRSPQSFAQQRLWFIAQIDATGHAYHVPMFSRLRGPIDDTALEKSIALIVQRHGVLRTVFTEENGQPLQHVLPAMSVALQRETLSLAEGQDVPQAIRARAERAIRQPFDLRQGPLLRAILVRVDAEDHVLLFAFHHIIFDGWSIDVLSKELSAAYTHFANGAEPSLPPLPIQYADYAQWQRSWLQGDALDSDIAWWKHQLAGAPPILELPTDRPRPPVHSFHGANIRVPLPSPLHSSLLHLARQEGSTLFMSLLAGFQLLLSRYSGQDDVVVGSPISGRNRREVEGLLGFFVNTLALRAQPAPDSSFRLFLRHVREACLGAFAHQDIPFEQLVDALKPPRDLSRTPLFQVMFVLQGAASPLSLPGAPGEEFAFQTGVSRFDLMLYVRETPRGLEAFWEFNTALFDEATVRRMADHYVRLLEAATTQPDSPLSRLTLLSQQERHQLLVDWNDARPEAPRLIHHLVEAQAARTPDAVAVTHGSDSLTYAQLDARANQLAHHLRALGVSPLDTVGLCLERSSLDMPVAVLASLKAGAAYLPLDPSYPAERLAFMLKDASASLVLAHTLFAASLPSSTQARIVRLDEHAADIARCPTHSLALELSAETPCYVIYTSGSTGKPKGIVMPHRAASNMLTWQLPRSRQPTGTTLQFASLNFDVSFQELFGTWGCGGTLLLITSELRRDPPALLRHMARHQVTRLFAPFVALQALCDAATHEAELPPLTEIITAGEQLQVTPALVAFFERLPECSLENQYGPSETHVATAWLAKGAPRTWPALPPVGVPITTLSVYILDASGEPSPIGVPGEVFIGGESLALGYHARPDLTAERFVPSALGTKPGARLYRTGDKARWLAHQNIEFLGRLDGQVKLRGFRIELGEVESALRALPHVQDAVAVVREDIPGRRQLVGYVMGPATEWDTDRARRTLARQLPEYMVPAALVRLDALPLLPSGKVHRGGLPAVSGDGLAARAFVPARTALEKVIADIWAPLLGVSEVGARDHFFELGGHSLLATQVASRLREALQTDFPIRLLFELPNLSDLAARLETLRQDAPGVRAPAPIAVPRDVVVPQSFAQQRLWFIAQIDRTGHSYNVPIFTRLKGTLNVQALERTLRELIRRHEVLRTTFAEVDGQPVQCIAPDLPFSLVVKPLAEDDRDDNAIRAHAEHEVRQPFDLRHGPLFRASVLRVHEDDHVVLLNFHHTIFDGWSIDVLSKELSAAYTHFANGAEPSLPPLPIQYADYAQWQRSWLQGDALDSDIAWWKHQLAGAPPILELPTDRPRPPVHSFHGANIRVPLPSPLHSSLLHLARQEGSTLFMSLLAGFQLLLSRYSGQDDVVVGSPISGRNRREVEGLLGFFVNTLALRAQPAPDSSFRLFLRHVREACLGAFAHQDIPFEQLVDALKPPRDLSRTPLFQVMFVLQGAASPLSLPGAPGEEFAFQTGVSRFDLMLYVRETPRGLEAFWEFNTALFDEATVRRMADHYVRLLEAATTQPDSPLSRLTLLSQQERHQLLVDWNDTRVTSASPHLIHQLVEAQAARTPDAVAVTHGSDSLTYAQLDARANQLAHHLRSLGVSPLDTVGLCLERSSLDMPVAVLASLKAGAAYLPLDPSYPAERLAFMLKDASASLVLAHTLFAASLPSSTQARIVRLDEHAADIALCPTHSLALELSPETPCYFVYTSGSTGKPKGIVMSHRAVGYMLDWLTPRHVLPTGTTLQFASLNFDVSFQELFGTWRLGGRVLLVTSTLRQDPVEMLRYMVRHQVDRLYLPFVALQALCDAAAHEPELPPLVEVITAGEQLQVTPALVAFFERLPGCILENQYGPSEAHAVSTWRASGPPSTWPALPPVGVPMPRVQLYVLDTRGEPCPIGVPGEIFVGGETLAHGYHARPDLTADRFIPSHLDSTPGARLYRTGDKARWLANGNLEFLGRLDGQVKLRGFRIELGEVESALRAAAGVKDAIVVVREDTPGVRRLVGYLILSPETPWEPEALRTSLARRLPEYMVPAALVRLDALPLMPSGKVNRGALPPPDASQDSSLQRMAPRTALELQLARIFEEVLGVSSLGVRDSFFELGGHSLLAVRLLARVREATGRALPVATLFQNANVESLAAVLRQAAEGPRADGSPLVEFRGGKQQRPFFCVHAVGGNVLSYIELARALGDTQPFYGLQARGLEGDVPPCQSIPEMATLYLAAIRAVQPQGPYLLGGWSLGGSIALEMAQQLREQGEEVELLVLIDTYARLIPKGETPNLQVEATRASTLFYQDLLRAAGHALPLPDAELEQLEPSRRLQLLEEASRATAGQPLQALRDVFQTHLLLGWTYEPRAYPGRVLLLEASEPARTRGWEEFITGPLEIQTIPGDHYSILRGARVQQLATALRTALEKARAPRPEQARSA
ncbi:non-ribosomal peptide synthetase [Corallococcus sp. H22C18031201]|nr:non-ribosomal peptide synthetase [Corallococcus sp. H22C18031201]